MGHAGWQSSWRWAQLINALSWEAYNVLACSPGSRYTYSYEYLYVSTYIYNGSLEVRVPLVVLAYRPMLSEVANVAVVPTTHPKTT